MTGGETRVVGGEGVVSTISASLSLSNPLLDESVSLPIHLIGGSLILRDVFFGGSRR